MNYKKIFNKGKNSLARLIDETMNPKQQDLIDFLCKNTKPKIYRNFHFSDIYGESCLMGYSKVIGIFKKDSIFLRSLISQIPYQPAVHYGSSGVEDNGMAFSFSGFNYHKNFINVALKIVGSENDILIRVPVSNMAPLFLFSNKVDYIITIAPMAFYEK